MKFIQKYSFRRLGFQSVEIPWGWKPVFVGLDPKGQPSIWCEVDPDNDLQRMRVWLLKNECEVPNGADHYVGSFQHGPNVIHVYTEQWAV